MPDRIAPDRVSPDRLSMESDQALVEVAPQHGGALAAFDFKNGADRVAILRRWTGESDNPRAFACNPLVPWFNRISGGGFSFDGTFYPIAPNDPDDPFPLHGDGWLTPWQVSEASAARIVLTLRSGAIPPFDYEATQVLTLAGTALTMEISLTHLGKTPIPYGLGFHPWLERTPGVTLHAPATGAWLAQPPDFPTSPEPDPVPAKWDFSAARALPEAFIDNGFAGWSGRAEVHWQDRGVAVEIAADPAINLYHLYSLGADCPIFCFEPVTNPNGAFNKPGGPAANHLRVLTPGESTSLTMRLTARSI